MISDKIFGWGSIIIGCAVLCPAIYEIASGTYSPVGYGARGGWIKGFFNLLFAANGPYISALMWLAMGCAFIWAGISSLKTPHRETKFEKFSGQKPRVRGKK